LLRCAQTLASVKRAPLDSRNIHKILRQNDSYPARAAIAGWIAVSDAQIDRNGKPIGTDLANVRRADLTRLASWPAGRLAGWPAGGRWSIIGAPLAAGCGLHDIAPNLALEQGGAGWENIRPQNRASVI
jgi:hypothetical protein